jgi:hypothetical protein
MLNFSLVFPLTRIYPVELSMEKVTSKSSVPPCMTTLPAFAEAAEKEIGTLGLIT